MKNITVSVGDDVYYEARKKAVEEKKSVSAVVREALTAYASRETEFDRQARREKELRTKIRARMAERDFSNGDTRNLTREELYDREVFRRFERSSL